MKTGAGKIKAKGIDFSKIKLKAVTPEEHKKKRNSAYTYLIP